MLLEVSQCFVNDFLHKIVVSLSLFKFGSCHINCVISGVSITSSVQHCPGCFVVFEFG
jgi:hypothetical protein